MEGRCVGGGGHPVYATCLPVVSRRGMWTLLRQSRTKMVKAGAVVKLELAFQAIRMTSSIGRERHMYMYMWLVSPTVCSWLNCLQ